MGEASTWIPAFAGMTVERVRRGLVVTPAQAGVQRFVGEASTWIPAFAGMTGKVTTGTWSPAFAGMTTIFQAVMSGQRSRQVGLVCSIRAIFQARFQCLSCFSRLMAVVMSS